MKKSFKLIIVIIYCIGIGIACSKKNNLAIRKPVYDVDNNGYDTVRIGKQTWLTENLKVTRYRDSSKMDKIIDSAQWVDTKRGAYCAYNGDEAIAKQFGYLYNGYAALNPKLALVGYHVFT